MLQRSEPYKGITKIYDEVRPSYPEELIQDVISKTNVKCFRNLEFRALRNLRISSLAKRIIYNEE